MYKSELISLYNEIEEMKETLIDKAAKFYCVDRSTVISSPALLSLDSLNNFQDKIKEDIADIELGIV